MPTPDVSGIALKLGVTALTRAAPKGIDWLKSWYGSRELLVLGSRGVGKTSFVNYLRFGVLEPEHPTATTMKPIRINKLTTLALRSTTTSVLELHVKSLEDIPGHMPAAMQAELLIDRSPHVVVILADVTARDGRDWLVEFLTAYRAQLQNANRRSHIKRLHCLALLLNKFDKADKTRLSLRERQFRKLLDDKLSDFYAQSFIKGCPVVPCISVATELGSRCIDDAILSIALRVANHADHGD